MPLHVLDPGLFSLVVDHGRPRSRSVGVPLGGAADRASLAVANALLGNPADAPGLELTLVGPTLRADKRTACAVFGAPFLIAIANRGPVAAGRTFVLEPGDAVKVGGTPTGARGYLCVGGGFDPPAVLGSRSGLAPVTTGDVLPCGESACRGRALPFAAFPEDGPLRVLPGPQAEWFLNPDQFFATTYTVAPASDRMGVRLVGDPLERRPGELASEAVAPGAVQVTNDGRPVVLGVDGQTIGGYPKIAHVIRADLDRLARLRPGDPVRFRGVTPKEAADAARKAADAVGEWLTRLAVSRVV